MFNELFGGIFNKSFGIFNDFSVLFCELYFYNLYILCWYIARYIVCVRHCYHNRVVVSIAIELMQEVW